MTAAYVIKVRSGQYADILTGRRSYLITRDRDLRAGDAVELEEVGDHTAAPTGRSLSVIVTNVDRELRTIAFGYMGLGFRVTGELNDVVQYLYRQVDELRADYDECLEALRLHAPSFEPRRKAA